MGLSLGINAIQVEKNQIEQMTLNRSVRTRVGSRSLPSEHSKDLSALLFRSECVASLHSDLLEVAYSTYRNSQTLSKLL